MSALLIPVCGQASGELSILTAKIAPGSPSEIANPVRGAIFSSRSVASDVVTADVVG
jgi:hypothetical protein